MGMLAKIRRMRLRDQLSVREITRRTGLSRNTIRNWLKHDGSTEPRYPPRVRPTLLDPYKTQLHTWLTSDQHRAARERRTARVLFQLLQAQGYPGSYGRVATAVRQWREHQADQPHRVGYVPLTFELGVAFQFDWSCEYAVIGGIRQRLDVAHVKLAASRAFWLVAYPTQSHEMVFDAHTRAFIAFGGVPRRGIYDNMKTAVDRVSRGKERNVNARFLAMCSHYLFEPEFCNRAAGWEKGIVEQNARVSTTALVAYQRNRYSVPSEHAHHILSLRVYPSELVMIAEGREVARHRRCFERDQTLYDWQHYIPLLERKPGALRNGAPFTTMPAPFLALRQHMLRHVGGDRVMAQVLAAVPVHGIEAVQVAVELALESGRPSSEHVLNVLARLKSSVLITETPAITLLLVEEPRADVQRYDELRTKEVCHVE